MEIYFIFRQNLINLLVFRFFYFQGKEVKIKSQKVSKSTSLRDNKSATLASYEVAQLVAKFDKAHNIAEELIFPVAIVLCKRWIC